MYIVIYTYGVIRTCNSSTPFINLWYVNFGIINFKPLVKRNGKQSSIWSCQPFPVTTNIFLSSLSLCQTYSSWLAVISNVLISPLSVYGSTKSIDLPLLNQAPLRNVAACTTNTLQSFYPFSSHSYGVMQSFSQQPYH